VGLLRELLRHAFLIWLLAGMGFWIAWVVAAPAYDSGGWGGVLFFGAYTLGMPFFLSTALLHTVVGTELAVGHHMVAILLGAAPLWLGHRLLQARLGPKP
jgi:hypothetical protein